MRPTLPVLASLLLVSAPAAAQGTIRPGQNVTGELIASDPRIENGSRYHVWRFQGEAQHMYRVTLRSGDFDAYLVVGSDIRPGCDACSTDDDGGGGTDAMVEYQTAEDGTLEIRANSFDGDALGRYDLLLEDDGIPAPIITTPITLGETVQGELGRGDDKDHGRSYSDTYSYQGRAGERLVIVLASEDFDTQVNFGMVTSEACMELDYNDDDGTSTNSRLAVTLAEDGEYHVHVGSSRAGQRGRYTLVVQRGEESEREEETAVALPLPLSPGETMEGLLDEGDPRADDDSLYELWSFMGQVGETVTITMRSDEFDTYLALGRMTEGGWQEIEVNDDGPEGTDSELTVTLPQNGEYLVRANAFSAGETGHYTLRLDND